MLAVGLLCAAHTFLKRPRPLVLIIGDLHPLPYFEGSEEKQDKYFSFINS